MYQNCLCFKGERQPLPQFIRENPKSRGISQGVEGRHLTALSDEVKL